MFEFFISKKYLRSKHKTTFISIISAISTLGVTIGVAALIIVISVFNGFGSLVTEIMLKYDPHIVAAFETSPKPLALEEFENYLANSTEIQNYHSYAEGKVILMNKNSYQVIELKGLPEFTNDSNWGIGSSMLKGDISYSEENNFEIALGLRMAIRLSCRVGDTLSVTSFNGIERILTDFTAIPNSRNFVVSGIFETNNKDYDIQFGFTSQKSAQRALNIGNKISGYEIFLNDVNEADGIKEELLNKFSKNNIRVNSWFDLHKDLYTVMLIERWAAFIILCLIISVATFNILGSLTMSVIEKKKDIAVLRSMGANSNSIVKIFMFEGLLIGFIGTISGLLLGLLVCYIQIEYKIYPLDPTKYIIDAIPIQLRFTDIAAVTTAAFLLTFLSSLLPAKRAARVNIIEAIKYE
ncbi:MAG: ABC transporter permease [Bacteroidetes bacterium]|nr:ABC transporter permease [Bacteroidota bacterium]MBU1677971.1 ABC transporter permease [Bacteroidota bacterium]